MKAHIERIVAAMQWADRRVIGALEDCPEAHDEALPLLGHLLGAEHVWLARLECREASRSVWPGLSLVECEALAAENAAGYTKFLDRLTEERLAEVVRYTNTKGVEFATPVVDILTHVVIHSAYHRGQIAKAMGRAGTPAADTDYIAYVRSISGK